MAEETKTNSRQWLNQKSMGPGGGDVTPEEDSFEIDVDDSEELPEGIELDDGQELEVMAEAYDHNANLAEVMEEGVLGSLASDLTTKS